jgi:cell division cycle protein 37
LLLRIGKLIEAVEGVPDRSGSADETVLQALVRTSTGLDNNVPPPPPGVHSGEKGNPSYSEMMARLVDMVKKDVDESKTEDRWSGFLAGLKDHQQKVDNLQGELHERLAELELEESRKITSDKLTEGFSYSQVSKGAAPTSVAKEVPKATQAELLNPGVVTGDASPALEQVSSGAEADVEDATGDDENTPQPSKLGKEFGKIKLGDYMACKNFIMANPDVVSEADSDALLMTAFNDAIDQKDNAVKLAVHQSLLLQYVRQIGRAGVEPFFKR